MKKVLPWIIIICAIATIFSFTVRFSWEDLQVAASFLPKADPYILNQFQLMDEIIDIIEDNYNPSHQQSLLIMNWFDVDANDDSIGLGRSMSIWFYDYDSPLSATVYKSHTYKYTHSPKAELPEEDDERYSNWLKDFRAIKDKVDHEPNDSWYADILSSFKIFSLRFELFIEKISYGADLVLKYIVGFTKAVGYLYGM